MDISLDRSIAPAIIIPKRFDLQKVESFYLSNGSKVSFISSFNLSVVKMEMTVNGGSSIDGATFKSYFAAKMLDQGTKNRSQESISDFIAFRGASLEIVSGNDKLVITVYCLRKYFEEINEILLEIINESEFSESHFLRIKDIETQNLLLNESKNSYLASTSFVSNLFPNHYYGKKMSSDLARSIDFDVVRAYYNQKISNVKFDFLLSGSVGQNELDILERVWSSQEKEIIEERSPISVSIPSDIIEIKKEGSVQGAVKYGCQTISKNHEDYAAWSITNEIFGGYFGSRLMSNIREDKGFTYGIGSYLIQLKHCAYFQISTEVKADKSKETIGEIEKEIDILHQELVTDKELQKVKNFISGSFANSLNTSFELMDKYKAIEGLGLDYNFYDKYFEELNQISAQKIQDTAQKYLSKNAVKIICR